MGCNNLRGRWITGFLALVVILGLMWLNPGVARAAPIDQQGVSGVTNFDYAREVVDGVNAERAAEGLAPLVLDEELTSAAMLRAGETAVAFSHVRPNGLICTSVSSKAFGENIAMGYMSPSAVMQGWMQSEGHRANILSSRYRSIGVGCINVGGSYYWVQLFGIEEGIGDVPYGSYSVTMPTMGIAGRADGNGAEMQRLYNPYTGEHFYTESVAEAYALVAVGWGYEGIGWTAPASGAPVYRLFNSYAAGGDHHYTTSAIERDALVAEGWSYEGVGWRSAEDSRGEPADGAVPLYRQYNPFAATGTHNYTTSKFENDSLVSAGWREEGIAWYGVG